MKLLLLSLLFTLPVWAQVPVPYDSMLGCKRHFTNWAQVEHVQLEAFSDAFPETIWEGTLENRVKRLQELWPDNIKIVDDVIFEAKSLEGTVTGSQKKPVVVVSMKGMREDDAERLKKDYTDAVSWLTVSFPLKDNGDHLYTRIGDKSIDYFGWITKDDYIFGKSDRIEPIIELSPEEQFRLNTYAKNATENVKNTLGTRNSNGADYAGAPDANGKLDDNKGICKKHNCTSWMGLAPIGDQNEMLVNMIGAQKSWNIHTSPGWFLQHLTSKTNKSRVPFVFFFSRKDLSELTTEKIKKDEVINWNWNLPE